ncbi:hypothetical protein OA410_01205 [Paracoccaceae bacterium]|nr:hypothetical protein [Paracoccaceae bacterium]
MIYFRQKIDSFTETFEKCSVIVLHGENYSLLQKDAKKISDALAGKNANKEMRVNKYFNHEINEKRNEIITSLKTKSFFPGRQIILLNALFERDYKIIAEIDAEWQNDDAITIVTMNALSKKSEVIKLITSSDRIALVNYTNSKIDRDFFVKKFTDAGINFSGNEVLDVLIDFANFTPENILENELEKLMHFKLYDDKPLSLDDFFDIMSIDYEVKELSLAVALAERNITELEKTLSAFLSYSKSPISILHFVSAYFYKLSLIKLHGPTSFEARREYPFLIAHDLEKAKQHVKQWSLKQISRATDSLTALDLKLRKYPSLFRRSILTQSLHKIMEI